MSLSALSPPVPRLLTFEEYIAEGEINQRYDIVGGVRQFMPGPSMTHQEIALNIAEALRNYQRISGIGRTIMAPFDVIIERYPRLRVRQPDVLFITHHQLTSNEGDAFLSVAPELVVEIVSDSETERSLGDKLADYQKIGVKEGWLVRPTNRTVEVLELTPQSRDSIGVYGEGETFASFAFPDLMVSIEEVFRA